MKNIIRRQQALDILANDFSIDDVKIQHHHLGIRVKCRYKNLTWAVLSPFVVNIQLDNILLPIDTELEKIIIEKTNELLVMDKLINGYKQI